MNKTEHLLTCLIEECAEIQKAATKALRFGLEDGFPGRGTTNAYDIWKECIDLKASIEMLEEEKLIKNTGVPHLINEKKLKVMQYMEYAQGNGTLIATGAGGA